MNRKRRKKRTILKMKFIVLALLCVVAYAAAQAEPEAIEEYHVSILIDLEDSIRYNGTILVVR